MPFFVRTASPTFTSFRTGAPELKTVGFPPTPVTGVSRPLNAYEAKALYDFELHAKECMACFDPYEIHRSHGRLCHSGNRLAQNVAAYVYSHGDGAHTHSVGDGSVRVEVPAHYHNVRSLLRAMERSQRHRRQAPIISQARAGHPVVERSPMVSASASTHHHHGHRLERRDTPRYEVRQPSHTVVESATRRQSVYPSYSTEVRTPKYVRESYSHRP